MVRHADGPEHARARGVGASSLVGAVLCPHHAHLSCAGRRLPRGRAMLRAAAARARRARGGGGAGAAAAAGSASRRQRGARRRALERALGGVRTATKKAGGTSKMDVTQPEVPGPQEAGGQPVAPGNIIIACAARPGTPTPWAWARCVQGAGCVVSQVWFWLSLDLRTRAMPSALNGRGGAASRRRPLATLNIAMPCLPCSPC